MLAHVLVSLVLLLVAARAGGALAERLGQPAVLGELLAGVGLGALPLFGIGGLSWIPHDRVVEALAELGVILLLFEVGLSTRLADLAKVGLSAFLVACIGVVVPMLLGYGVGVWLLPGAHPLAHWFLGAALSATSVGITARVLRDMGQVASAEGQISSAPPSSTTSSGSWCSPSWSGSPAGPAAAPEERAVGCSPRWRS